MYTHTQTRTSLSFSLSLSLSPSLSAPLLLPRAHILSLDILPQISDHTQCFARWGCPRNNFTLMVSGSWSFEVSKPTTDVTSFFVQDMFLKSISQMAWLCCPDTSNHKRTTLIINCWSDRLFTRHYFFKHFSTTSASRVIPVWGKVGCLLNMRESASRPQTKRCCDKTAPSAIKKYI